MEVVKDWYEAIFRIKAQEPYPHSNDGQKLGALEVLPVSDRYIYYFNLNSTKKSSNFKNYKKKLKYVHVGNFFRNLSDFFPKTFYIVRVHP